MIMYIENGDFVGIVNGVPYSSSNEEDMRNFFEKYVDYGDLNEIITDGLNMLDIVLGKIDFYEEFEENKNIIFESIQNLYTDLLKDRAEYIITTPDCEEEF